jgi:Lipocalin-like domain
MVGVFGWYGLASATEVSPGVPRAVDMEKLYGTWQLVSFTQRFVATGETIDVFGRNPKGFLSYSRDGRMNAILVKDVRPKQADMAQATTEDKVQLFSSMYAYAGTFTVDGNTVTHHVDISWNENWTGTDQVRNVKFDGDTLYISTNPQSDGIDGRIIVAELVWEKVK